MCLAGGEVIPFSYSLGNPQGPPASQARFGIFLDNTNYPGNDAGPFSAADSTVVVAQVMTPQSGTVTAAVVGGLYQIGFEAIQPASGNGGNYITDVSITLKPLVDFSSANEAVGEGGSGFLLVRVNGTVPVGGIQVSLQPGAATATAGDFTLGTPVAFGSSIVGTATMTTNGAGGYLLFIPPGQYDGNSLSDSRNETATNPSGSVRIPVDTTADTIIEDNETFTLTVEAPGSNGSSPSALWDLSTAASCSPAPAVTTTVAIEDNDVDLLTTKIVSDSAPPPGSSVTYTVAFTNSTARPTAASLTAHDAIAAIADVVPPGVTFTAWTCTAANGASCPGGIVNGSVSGSGPVSGDASLPAGNGAAGGTVTYSITAAVGAAQCNSVMNTSTIALPAGLEEGTSAGAGFTTPAPGGSANDSASVVLSPACVAALAATKTDGSATYTPGTAATYAITITNGGTAAATDLSVADALPSGVTLTATPTCMATGTATCGTIMGSAGGTAFAVNGATLANGLADR
ncbi:MAG TPA: hypothetical protein VEU30_07425 [Thermoanaerobaculia bacterium]|nr:hypothetical protein [Thermoanaerobaculia bacterium]